MPGGRSEVGILRVCTEEYKSKITQGYLYVNNLKQAMQFAALNHHHHHLTQSFIIMHHMG